MKIHAKMYLEKRLCIDEMIKKQFVITMLKMIEKNLKTVIFMYFYAFSKYVCEQKNKIMLIFYMLKTGKKRR